MPTRRLFAIPMGLCLAASIAALGSGAAARPDPKRHDLFEIEDETQVFYIHIGKPSGKVTLLALWDREAK